MRTVEKLTLSHAYKNAAPAVSGRTYRIPKSRYHKITTPCPQTEAKVRASSTRRPVWMAPPSLLASPDQRTVYTGGGITHNREFVPITSTQSECRSTVLPDYSEECREVQLLFLRLKLSRHRWPGLLRQQYEMQLRHFIYLWVHRAICPETGGVCVRKSSRLIKYNISLRLQ